MPEASPFVHLHVHSEYSILDGACRIPELAARAAELEMPAVALTDHGSLAGAVELYRESEKHGVKAILGCEVYVADDRRALTKGYAHLTLLAEDNTGYANLIKLASSAYLEGYYYKPRVDWELLNTHSQGLIALSGCLSGRVCKALENGNRNEAESELARLKDIFGADSTFIEIQDAGLDVQKGINKTLAEIAAQTNLPLVATGDVHYLRYEDARAHEALLCIQSGDSLQNPAHWKFDTDQFYFKTPAEMGQDFADYPEAVRNTLLVAERCNVSMELGRILLPTYPTPDDRDAFDYLVELCEKGLQKRYDKVTPELQERLKFELKTIKEMGFADYFLIVWDFIAFAKKNGIGVGPGRGSAAGSLVAYCLEITDIDPIKYDLLFERFLNPGRKSMPDIDIDFSVHGRDQVINYVADKYGRDRVAQIITFGTMMARAAVRDAGRVLEIPYGTVDRIAKLIPEGPKVYLDDCLKPGAELKKSYDEDEITRQIVDLAKPLEGLVRQDSIHAAGVVIGDRPLTDYVPLQQKGADQEVVTQFAMEDVEALGLLKMDFLGLRNLDVIEKAEDLTGIDIARIPLDDAKTYAMLAKGDSVGVFQFEGSGMREALRQVKPTEFEDLIALVALFRPGPMGYIPVYAKRKAGAEQVQYLDDRLKPITESTYGICLTGDSLVFDAASGRRVRLDSLAEHSDVVVQGVDDDLSPAHARITAWMDNGVRPVYRLRLRNGAMIKATGNHEVLTERGWERLENLRPGDHVATPSKLSLVGEGRWLDERERARIKVLAYLLADGSLSTSAPPTFYSSDLALLDDFTRVCEEAFAGVKLTRYTQARDVVRISAGRDLNVVGAYHSPSPLEEWLRDRGLRWKLSDERANGSTRKGPHSAAKWVPEEVFELAEEEIARFLAALWDCDGHVGKPSVFFKTTSPRMAVDVQSLLLRLGIRSAVCESTYNATEKGRRVERRAYQVTAHGTQRFAELVQPFMVTGKRFVTTNAQDGSRTVGREAALREILEAATDLVPVGGQQMRGGRLSVKALSAQTGINYQHFYPAARSRSRIDVRCLNAAMSKFDLPLTSRAVRLSWQEIESIEPVGEERVYDVTVDGIHNFVANNIVVHNCIYQESYMEIAKQLAGFSPAEADDLRKAIGKKIHKLMASLKDKFLEGCAGNGVTPGVANQLWKDMEQAQDYSFNKSHAACYALIAYRTAYLKANRPAEYMAALISSVMNTKDRVPLYVLACKEMGIEVEPPDVNLSQNDFAVVEGKIRFGLNAVKNVGETAARAIVTTREEGGPFETVWDFVERVDPQNVNKRALEALVKCGALGSTGVSRMGLLEEEMLDRVMGWGSQHQEDQISGQSSIFDLGGEQAERPRAPIPAGEYDKKILLALEKESLGLYVSEHPLDAIKDALRRKVDCHIVELERRRDGEVLTVGGIVGSLRQTTTKKGEPMVFLRLDDVTGSVEAIVFNSVYNSTKELLEADRVLVVKGRIDHKEGETKLIALEVAPFEAAVERKEVRLRLDARKAPHGLIGDLRHLIEQYPGETKVLVAIDSSEGPHLYEFGPGFRVRPEADFFAEAKSLLGEAAVN